MASVPSASSVTAMSATLMRALVLVFSARLVVVFASATAVGASFTSVTEIANCFSTVSPPWSVLRTRTE